MLSHTWSRRHPSVSTLGRAPFFFCARSGTIQVGSKGIMGHRLTYNRSATQHKTVYCLFCLCWHPCSLANAPKHAFFKCMFQMQIGYGGHGSLKPLRTFAAACLPMDLDRLDCTSAGFALMASASTNIVGYML